MTFSSLFIIQLSTKYKRVLEITRAEPTKVDTTTVTTELGEGFY